jgi:hypothetical protein
MKYAQQEEEGGESLRCCRVGFGLGSTNSGSRTRSDKRKSRNQRINEKKERYGIQGMKYRDVISRIKW